MKPAEAAVGFYLFTFALPLPLDIGLLGLAIVGGWTALRQHPRFPPHAFIPLLGIAPLLLAGNLHSAVPARSLDLSLALLPAVCCYLLVCGFFAPPQRERLCLTLTALGAATGAWLLGVAAAHPRLTPTQWIQEAALTALKVPNDVVVLAILLPFAAAALQLRRSPLAKALALGAIAVAILVPVVYRSRLALLCTAAALLGYPLAQRKRVMAGKALLLFPATVLAVDAALGFHLTGKLLGSWSSRLPLWIAAWKIFLHAPFAGSGIGSYVSLYREFLDPARLPAWMVYDPRITPWAHNLYLEILAETGIVGVGALLPLAWIILHRWHSRDPGNAPERSAWCALGVFAIAALFELSLWRQWVAPVFMVTFGCLMGTDNNSNTDKEESHDSHQTS